MQKPHSQRAVLSCALFFGLLSLAFGQASNEVAASATEAVSTLDQLAENETLGSVLDLLKRGGIMMIPLGLASILLLALAIERYFATRATRLVPRKFYRRLQEALGPNANNIEAGIAFCHKQRSPAGRIFKSTLLHQRRGDAAMEKALEDAGAREVNHLRRRARGLSIIAGVTPLLGLLGTVTGMIGAFQSAMLDEVQKAQTLKMGIYEALISTAVGLTIAIPALLLYHYILGRIDHAADRIEDTGNQFLLDHADATASRGENRGESISRENNPHSSSQPLSSPSQPLSPPTESPKRG